MSNEMLTLPCYQVKSLEVRSLDMEFLKNSSRNSPIHSFVSEFILFSSDSTAKFSALSISFQLAKDSQSPETFTFPTLFCIIFPLRLYSYDSLIFFSRSLKLYSAHVIFPLISV